MRTEISSETTWDPVWSSGQIYLSCDDHKLYRLRYEQMQWYKQLSGRWERVYHVPSGQWRAAKIITARWRQMGPEVRRWMMEHPGRCVIAKDSHMIAWWSEEECLFQGELPINNEWLVRPLEGDPWEDEDEDEDENDEDT